MTTGVSRDVKSQMGHLLRRVRQKSGPPEDEEITFDDESDPENLQYYEEEEEDDDYLDHPVNGKWEVRYDNQNYIRSLVNEDKGLHRIADYPKQKWEVSHSNRAHVRNLEPYPVRVSIDHGSDVGAQWHIPYDNKNYILGLLAGSGISKAWEEGLIDPETVNERHGHLRNPFDYLPQKDEVIRSAYKEQRPRRESYRFNRVERNVHDYETDSVPGDEVTRPHPRDQRRRSTHIYRYGDVERNVHDYADPQYSRSSPRYSTVAQKPRTRYDAIAKWKKGMENVDYETQNVDYETQNVDYETQNVDYGTQNVDYETQNVDYGTQNVDYGTQNVDYETQNVDYETQNIYNEELGRHYNQYGVEASAHDYDENRAVAKTEARKRILPMSVVNVMRKHGNNKGRRFREFAESYRDRLRDSVPVRRNVYERIPEGYGDEDDYYEYVPAPGRVYEDVVEEHKYHPYDYGTTQEDSYREYKEDDDSQTWVSTNEKYAEIHHRSQ